MSESFRERLLLFATEHEDLQESHRALQENHRALQQLLQNTSHQMASAEDIDAPDQRSSHLGEKAQKAASEAMLSLKTALSLDFGGKPEKSQRKRHAEAVEKFLSKPVSADAAAKAYDIFCQMSLGKEADCAGQQQRESREAWLEARKAARFYLICCACLPHGTTEWHKVEHVLVGVYGEERIGSQSGYDIQLRSQLCKCYDDEFPGARDHRHRNRPAKRQNRGAALDGRAQFADGDAHLSSAIFPTQQAGSTVDAAEPVVEDLMQHEGQSKTSPDDCQREEICSPAQHLPVRVHENVYPTSSCPTSPFRVTNTFLDVLSEDDCLSQGESAKSWPQVAGNLAERTQVIKKKAYQNKKTLNPEVTGRGVADLDAIIEGEPEETSALLLSAVRSHAFEPMFVQKILDALQHSLDAPVFLDKVQCLAKELPRSAESAVAICCRALGQFARTEAGSQICSSIATSLLHIMEYLPSEVEVQTACLESILEVCREAREVFALGTLPHQVESSTTSFNQDLRTRLHKAMTAVTGESPESQSVVVKILARTQPVEVVLSVVGSDVDLLGLALAEVFYTLEESFVCLHQEHDDGGKARACQLLQRVMAQRPEQASSPCMAGWVRDTSMRGRYGQMEKRLALVGIVFGPEAVARLLSTATSNCDEELISVSSRALSIICDDLADDVGAHVRDEVNRCAAQNRTQLRNLWSQGPMVGCVGSVNRSRARVADADPLLCKALESVIGLAKDYFGNNWMSKASGFHHEVLWTIENVFKDVPSLGAWEKPICEVARPLVEYWRSERDKDPSPEREEVKIANLADKLLCWESAPEWCKV